MPVVEVLHLTGEELDIGPADAGSIDVDQDFSGHQRRDWNLFDTGLAGPPEDERLHRDPCRSAGSGRTSL